MSWETPAALWLGLTIPAIVALWILRPRRSRMRVSSLLLWPGSPAERQSARPWQRLRNHPLLWLQVLAAALLALVAARPFLPATPAAQHLVVLLDASGSMRAVDVAPSRFDSALATVRDLANGLGPGQQMTVIRLDEQPRVLVANAASASQVESALRDQSPSFGSADLGVAIALAESVAQGPAEWIVIGDGGLDLPDDARRPPGVSFRFIRIGNQAANVALAGLAAREGDGSVTVLASLRNFGDAPASGTLRLFAEGQLVSAREWSIDAGGQTHLTWSQLPTGPRWYRAQLAADATTANLLGHDDDGWTVIATANEPEVLLVSDGNSFLERILGVYAGIRASRIGASDWPSVAASGASYQLVVFDRASGGPEPKGSSLRIGPTSAESFRPREIWPRADHPLLRHVDLSDVHVAAAQRLALDDGWETVIDSDGGPLLAVREVDGRRQAALAFSLGESDLPLRPAFPVLMANLIEWLLAQPAAAPKTTAPGTALAIDSSPLAQEVWVEDDRGVRYDLAPPWPPRPFQPPAPGLYQVVQAGEGLNLQSFLVASGFHPTEAAIAPRSVDLPALEAESDTPARGALAFWPWLAVAILIVAGAEWWLDARGR